MNKHLFISLFSAITLSVPAQELLMEKAEAHKDAIRAVLLSADGSTVFSTGMDRKVYARDAAKGSAKFTISSPPAPCIALAIDAAETMYAQGLNNNIIALVDVLSGKTLNYYKEHTGPVGGIAFNPVEDILASASDDQSVKLWSATSRGSLKTFTGHTGPVKAVVFSADGKDLLSGGADNKIMIWNTETGEAKVTIDAASKEVTQLAYSPDGTFFVSGGSNGSVTLWNAQGGKLRDLKGFKGSVKGLSVSPDAQYIAAAGENKTVVIWKAASGEVAKELDAHPEGSGGVAFSANGKAMATGGINGTLKTWKAQSLNIGPAVYPAGEAQLSVSDARIRDDNDNGIIEASEKASIEFMLRNNGSGAAFGVTAYAETEPSVAGLTGPKMGLGNIGAGGSRKISLPLLAGQDLAAAAGTIRLKINDITGKARAGEDLSFQSGGGSVYSYIMVTEHSYSSATGKAEIGAPITLKLKLKNASQGEARDIKVNYIFPPDVFGVNRRFEVIPSIPAGETKEIFVEFYASREFSKDEVKIAINLEGAYNNADDLIFAVKVNEDLPPTEMIAVNETPDIPNQPVFRGGNPLEGLNVAKAKDMVIGKYYALIIGIDKYKGAWTPLQNAVRDAKAVEALLKEKYRFDHFKVLYNEQATRTSIINELEWLVNNVKAIDNVFIYYSGHGEYKENLNKGFWVPADAITSSTSQYISNSDLQTYLNGVKSKHTLLVSDACFSGDIFRGNTISVPFAESEKYYKEVHNLASRQAITSGGIEPVMDGGKDGHSVFAYYFLKTLKENTARYFDAGQLYTKIKIPVINNSEQTPKLSPIKNTGDEGGQFIFIKK